jgi:pyrroloquinoline quinone biosynthesis protein B
MRVTVLGSAAGGGFPQWNCACSSCSRLRAGRLHSKARSQTQVVVSTHAGECYLLNASPDLRGQILSSSLLTPKTTPRHTPITGIFLPSADVDSIAGLLHLREFQPLRIYATSSVRRIVQEENRIFRVLDRSNPPAIWQHLPLDAWMPLAADNTTGGHESARCRAVRLGTTYPDYVSDSLRRSLVAGEAVIGLVFAEGGKQFFFAPSLPVGSGNWKECAQSSELCFLDGTFWSENELISAGISAKTASEIGHIPLSGPGGTLGQLRSATKTRRVLIHINNTNPILDEESPEHREVRDAGWEIAYDGMEFEL